MQQRVDEAKPTRWGWAPIAIAVLGVLLSLAAGYRDARQLEMLERLRFEQDVDSHIAGLQSDLREREVLMETVAMLFDPEEPIRPGALGTVGRSFLALSPEVIAISWVPAVPPERVGDALRAIRDSGVAEPLIFGQNRRPLDVPSLGYTPYVILDVEPKDSAQVLLGGSPTDWPERRATIAEAIRTGRVLTPGPTRLFQPPHPFAFLLYAPVSNESGTHLGVLSFAYLVDKLFARPRPAPTLLDRAFTFHVYDTDEAGQPRYLAGVAPDGRALATPAGTLPETGQTTTTRTVAFGGRTMRVAFVSHFDLSGVTTVRQVLTSAIGMLVTALIAVIVLLVVRGSRRLQAEVDARRAAEARLEIVVAELNHRVRNLLTIVQAIVASSFRNGEPVASAREVVTRRLQALANVMGLLTLSEWRGAALDELVTAELLPYAGRCTIEGPQLTLTPRAAQTMTMLVHELATNSAKHGALASEAGRVTVHWRVEGPPGARLFRFCWAEQGDHLVRPPSRRGFGSRIIEQVTPGDLGGTAAATFAPPGYRYDLEAPLANLVDAAAGSDGAVVPGAPPGPGASHPDNGAPARAAAESSAARAR